jgi:hypothetical protein
MKLPKQWLYWAQKAGLRPERKRGRGNKLYLVGRSRRWRVNCHNEFECSCPLEHFDRWANSRGAQLGGTPKTEAEFLASVRELRERSKDAR